MPDLPLKEDARMPAAVGAPEISKPEVLKTKPSLKQQENNVETIKSNNDDSQIEQAPLIR